GSSQKESPGGQPNTHTDSHSSTTHSGALHSVTWAELEKRQHEGMTRRSSVLGCLSVNTTPPASSVFPEIFRNEGKFFQPQFAIRPTAHSNRLPSCSTRH